MQIKGKKILVTGGLGFIGSHIAESLVSKGASVKIYDNYSTGVEENLKTLKNEIEIIKGDILNVQALNNAMKGMDIVSHQAAQLEITRAIDNPIEDLTTNTVGTLNVFQSCINNGIRRIMLASSAGVYGQAIKLPQEEDSHPTEPNWAYGVSKLANEKYSMIMKELYGLEITNLRYAIVFGPREWFGRVLTIFLKRAFDNKSLIVFGDGKQIRDFVFVKDVVEMHNGCIENDASTNQIFNVSSGLGTNINDLAKSVLGIIGKNLEIIHEDVLEGNASSYFERKRLPVELKTLLQSNKKAKDIVGWVPKTTLVDGLRQEWAWLNENSHRWKKMSY